MTATDPRTSLEQAAWLHAETSRRLMDVLTAGDEPARFVGGCVRDALLGHGDPDVDLDVTTPLLPHQVIERLEAAGMKALPTGIDHGTITAIVDGRSFEITTLRKDVACDGRHAEVAFTDDFELDAARRDFTINAMSCDCHGRLTDYFGGVADLEAGRVRFVGDARERVREDYLRILRFFRFFARFGRPPADALALAACRDQAGGLLRISGERIRSEMLKLLASDGVLDALDLMIETKVLRRVLPVDVEISPLSRLIAAAPESDALLRLAALLRSSSEPEAALAAADPWHLSNAQTARLERLVQEPLLSLPHSGSDAKCTIYRLGKEGYRDILMLSARSRSEIETALPLPEVPPFPLGGQDLITRGLAPGPAIGRLLGEVEDWWLRHDLRPDREACLEELEKRLVDSPPPRPKP